MINRGILLIVVVLSLACQSLMAQSGHFDLGARAGGMGSASVTLSDAWSMFHNIGGLAGVEQTTAVAAYQHRYAVSALSTMGGALAKPMLSGVAAISVFRFGGDLYNEQKVSLGFSNRFGLASLGLNLNYLQYSIEGAGSRAVLTLDFGGVAAITEHLVFGAQVSNINQAELSAFSGEKVPTVMTAGLSYRPSEALMLNAEMEKDLDFDAFLKFGIEYEIVEKVKIRTGLATEPFESAFGIGFSASVFTVDYAFSNNPDLGDVHELSITYRFKN